MTARSFMGLKQLGRREMLGLASSFVFYNSLRPLRPLLAFASETDQKMPYRPGENEYQQHMVDRDRLSHIIINFSSRGDDFSEITRGIDYEVGDTKFNIMARIGNSASIDVKTEAILIEDANINGADYFTLISDGQEIRPRARVDYFPNEIKRLVNRIQIASLEAAAATYGGNGRSAKEALIDYQKALQKLKMALTS